MRLYIEIAAGVILLIVFGLFVKHERTIGETKVHTADAKALSEARKRADAETALNVSKANKAHEVADSVQKALDAERATHPIGPVSVCHPYNSGIGVPKAGAGARITIGPAGPIPVQPVPDSVAGPDISDGFTTIVRAAERLAIQNREWQSR